MSRRLVTLRLLSVLLMLAGLPACRTIYFGGLNTIADPPSRSAATYIYDAERGLGLDVYTPDACQAAPVLVFFYGGSWTHGERRWYRFVGELFASRGVLTVIPDYRKAPDAPFPDYVQDGARALAYVRGQAAQWCGDPTRVFVSGHSAGAHIGALLATDGRYLAAHGLAPRQAMAGFIGLAGPYDFLPITSRSVRKAFPDVSRDSETQPVHYVDGDEPPMLLLHGRDDDLVWPRNSERLFARLRVRQVPAELVLLDELGHAGLLNTLGDAEDPAGVVKRMLGFIDPQASSQPALTR